MWYLYYMDINILNFSVLLYVRQMKHHHFILQQMNIINPNHEHYNKGVKV